MESFDKIEGLTFLTKKELTRTEGGFFAAILVAAEIYLVVCGLASAAGAATAYIQNQLD
ncbi:hypothetical protein [Mangrovibacterium sp.]|uniref:hypothetical protein n=1 Tax=Mangrovibacterium sp. TaxID=1961364 RepID=UPI0035684454